MGSVFTNFSSYLVGLNTETLRWKGLSGQELLRGVTRKHRAKGEVPHEGFWVTIPAACCFLPLTCNNKSAMLSSKSPA